MSRFQKNLFKLNIHFITIASVYITEIHRRVDSLLKAEPWMERHYPTHSIWKDFATGRGFLLNPIEEQLTSF